MAILCQSCKTIDITIDIMKTTLVVHYHHQQLIDPLLWEPYRKQHHRHHQLIDLSTCCDMGSLPATLEAAKAGDLYCCLLGHIIEVVDGEQSYVQAELKGTPTWVRWPPEHRPACSKKKFRNMMKFARRFLEALYGHPDLGT